MATPSTGTATKSATLENLVIRASAGTGKTYRLTNRFLGLLARGVGCDQILATTFTRKAAGEIFDRVLQRLAIAASDGKRAKELAQAIEFESLDQAQAQTMLRELTSRLHSLRIGTLDSYFIQIASSLALELGLPPGWRIADSVDDEQMRQEALERVLAEDHAQDIEQLMHLLTKGEAERGISDLLLNLASSLYDVFRETTQEAWHRIPLTKGLEDRELDDLARMLESLAKAEPSRTQTAIADDLARVRSNDWKTALGKGLMAKVLVKDNTFFKKEFSPEIYAIYERFITHSKSILVGQIAKQTVASADLLTRFHERYASLVYEQRSLRFDEVTRSLASGLGQVDAQQASFRMDGSISHLLLDEFQDTSLAQWQVLRPIAKSIAEQSTAKERGKKGTIHTPPSLFCVGDGKQAIYGWRGGLAEILDAFSQQIPGLKEETLAKSYRSSQPVIDAVNLIFQKMTKHGSLGNYEKSIKEWSDYFPEHSTACTTLPGHVTLETCDECPEGMSEGDVLLHYAVERIVELARRSPELSIGVLVRRNATVTRLVYELRRHGIAASEEGGSTLNDSAAVDLILSAIRLSDHPDDTAAEFHLGTSPLAYLLGNIPSPMQQKTFPLNRRQRYEASRRIRQSLQTVGYGETIFGWASVLAKECDRRDLSRLQQLIEKAYNYDGQSTLRADDFLKQIEAENVPDPVPAKVRVMTIHQSKGLEFDIVVLPELENRFTGQPPSFVTGRSKVGEPIDTVCRYAGSDDVRPLLPQSLQDLFVKDQERRVYETLCVMYVALTRAVHAMHILVSPSRVTKSAPAFPKKVSGLIRAALCDNPVAPPMTYLFECGDPEWWKKVAHTITSGAGTAPMPSEAEEVPPIKLQGASLKPKRNRKSESPSQKEGGNSIAAGDLLATPSRAGMEFGSMIHAMFEQLDWLEEFQLQTKVVKNDLLQRKLRAAGIDAAQAASATETFADYLKKPGVAKVLRREYYRRQAWDGFVKEADLAKFQGSIDLQVRREQRFAIRQAGQTVSGTIDRLVLVFHEGKVIAADIVDFKTDRVASPEEASLEELKAYYAPQIEAYRAAVAKQYHLEPKRVAGRLVFVSAGETIPMTGKGK